MKAISTILIILLLIPLNGAISLENRESQSILVFPRWVDHSGNPIVVEQNENPTLSASLDSNTNFIRYQIILINEDANQQEVLYEDSVNNTPFHSYFTINTSDLEGNYKVRTLAYDYPEGESGESDYRDLGIIVIDSFDNCTVPYDAMIITEDTNFCPGVYNINHGISIGEDNVVLEGNGATLNGGGPYFYGVTINNKSNVTVKNLKLGDYLIGIYLLNSNNNTLKNNIFTEYDTDIGMYLFQSNDNIIKNNAIELNVEDIALVIKDSKDNQIINNILIAGEVGISLSSSNYNIIKDNLISGGDETIRISSSKHNAITSNNINSGGTVFDIRAIEQEDYNHFILGNTVNGKPYHYFYNKDLVTLSGLDTSGIQCNYCDNLIIKNSRVTGEGIKISNVNSFLIKNNIIENTYGEGGLYIEESVDGELASNKITDNLNAIHTEYSANLEFTDNEISFNEDAIEVRDGENILFKNNLIENNEDDLIELLNSQNINFKFNEIKNNNPYSDDPTVILSTSLVSFNFNNIYDNTGNYEVLVEQDEGINIDFTNNYWGTTDMEEIQERIYDQLDDSSLDLVLIEPILLEPYKEETQNPAGGSPLFIKVKSL